MDTPTPKTPGWYNDPSGTLRWRDGQQWAPLASSAPNQVPAFAGAPAAPRTLALVALIVGGVAFLIGLVPVLGALVGLAAVVIALLALRARQSKGLSFAGLALGGVAVLASIGMTIGVAAINSANENIAQPQIELVQPTEEPATDNAVENTPEPSAPAPAATPTSTPTETPEEPQVAPEPEPELSLGQENAIQTAESYLDYTAFSRKGLIGQLKFEDFSTEEATFAVDYIDVDWNEQAALTAQSYLDYSSFSRSGLFDQLRFEGYTKKQATYGVKAVGY